MEERVTMEYERAFEKIKEEKITLNENNHFRRGYCRLWKYFANIVIVERIIILVTMPKAMAIKVKFLFSWNNIVEKR